MQFNSKYSKNLSYVIQILNISKKMRVGTIWLDQFKIQILNMSKKMRVGTIWLDRFNKFKYNLDDW